MKTQSPIIRELTQGMAEEIVAALPGGDTPVVVYQGAFVQACADAGWIELSAPAHDLPRQTVAKLYRQLSELWIAANDIPNA